MRIKAFAIDLSLTETKVAGKNAIVIKEIIRITVLSRYITALI